VPPLPIHSPLLRPLALTAVAAASLLFTSCAVAADAATPPTEDAANAANAASYSLGLSFSTQWREGGLDSGLAEAALLRGIHDGLAGKPLTAEDRARASAFLKTSYEAFGTRNQAAAAAFLANNGKEVGVVTTASGLQYLVLATGEAAGPVAAANDRVTVHYRGQLLDGTEFDSSIARGKPAVIRPTTVIAGWREALGLMHRGAKWRVFIPPELAYGKSPPPAIPPNSALIFEIEVLAIDAVGPAAAAAPAGH
jgi:FKBP-type peptidyl-prolyl cis-trans isomerase